MENTNISTTEDSKFFTRLLLHYKNFLQYDFISTDLINDTQSINQHLHYQKELLKAFLINISISIITKENPKNELNNLINELNSVVDVVGKINYNRIIAQSKKVRESLCVFQFDSSLTKEEISITERYEELKIKILINEQRLTNLEEMRHKKMQEIIVVKDDKNKLEEDMDSLEKEQCEENLNVANQNSKESMYKFNERFLTKNRTKKLMLYTDNIKIIEIMNYSANIAFIEKKSKFFKQTFQLDTNKYIDFEEVYILITENYDKINLMLNELDKISRNEIKIYCMTTKENINKIDHFKTEQVVLNRKTASNFNEFLGYARAKLSSKQILLETKEYDIIKSLTKLENRIKDDKVQTEENIKLCKCESVNYSIDEKQESFKNILNREKNLKEEISDLEEKIERKKIDIDNEKQTLDTLQAMIDIMNETYESNKLKALRNCSSSHYLDKKLRDFEEYLEALKNKTNTIKYLLEELTAYLLTDKIEELIVKNLCENLREAIDLFL